MIRTYAFRLYRDSPYSSRSRRPLKPVVAISIIVFH
jgi:hypothetical protein